LPQADRLRRMMGDVVEDCTKTQAHMSADDLNDGFILDGDDKTTLAYQVRDRAGSALSGKGFVFVVPNRYL
jgi:hypothetical protein